MSQDNDSSNPQGSANGEEAPQTMADDPRGADESPRTLLFMEWNDALRSLVDLVFHPQRQKSVGSEEDVRRQARRDEVARLLIILVTGIVLAWLLSPAMTLAMMDLGLENYKEGFISQKLIKADQDYDIVDERKTEQARQDAMDAVQKVYDLDESVPRKAKENLAKGFSLMREAIERVDADIARAKEDRAAEAKRRQKMQDEWEAAVAARERRLAEASARQEGAAEGQMRQGTASQGQAGGPAMEDGAAEARPDEPRGDAAPEAGPAGTSAQVQAREDAAMPPPPPSFPLPEIPDRESSILRAFGEMRETFRLTLGLDLSDEQFSALADDRFSAVTQGIIDGLLDRAYANGVVENADAMKADAVRAKPAGIAIRRTSGNGVKDELVMENVGEVAELRDLTRRIAHHLSDFKPDLEGRPQQLRRTILDVASRMVRINLSYNPSETEARRKLAHDGVKQTIIQLKKGEKIIGEGEKVSADKEVIFAHLLGQARSQDHAWTRLGIAILVMMFMLLVLGFSRVSLHRFSLSVRDEIFLSVTLALTLAITYLVVFVSDSMQEQLAHFTPADLYFLAPVAAGAMLVRVILSTNAALAFTLMASALVGFTASNSLPLCIYTLAGSLVAVTKLSKNIDRPAILKAGMWTAIANMLVIAALMLMGRLPSPQEFLYAMAFALASGAVLSPALVTALTPICEKFGYTTDLKLTELNNLNHPLIKRLMTEAPGTYNHSSQLTTLVEAGAEAIGANPLLAKVCALYHDVGKLSQPSLFAENQSGSNPLSEMRTATASKSIQSHVKEGYALAVEYRLPAPIADATLQHHGTRVTGFFYKKALNDRKREIYDQLVEARTRELGGASLSEPELGRLEEEANKKAQRSISKEDFSYPGPIPQSVEVALVMLADVVEATTRAQKPETLEDLRTIIGRSVDDIFREGQLADCEMTLRDLQAVKDAFFSVLKGSNHSRPRYPSDAPLHRRSTGLIPMPGAAQQGDGDAPSPSKAMSMSITPTPVPLSRIMPSRPPTAVPSFASAPTLIPVPADRLDTLAAPMASPNQGGAPVCLASSPNSAVSQADATTEKIVLSPTLQAIIDQPASTTPVREPPKPGA